MSNRALMQSSEPRKSIIELAEESGLFDINPSDLVYEAGANGLTYYDFVLSCSGSTSSDEGHKIYLAKFDEKVNLEYFETATVPANVFEGESFNFEVGLMTLGVITWRNLIAKSRVLCLINVMDNTAEESLKTLKNATSKFSCIHHVQATGRRNSTSSTSSFGSTQSFHNEGMRMRVLLCQARNTVDRVSALAICETKVLLNPKSNRIVCMCFNLVR